MDADTERRTPNAPIKEGINIFILGGPGFVSSARLLLLVL